MFVTTKQFFCHNKSMPVATKPLLRQNYVCRDKIFLLRQFVFRNRHVFVMTKVLSRQAYFFSQQKTSYIVTKVSLSQQNICHNRIMFVVTNICCDKTFDVTKIHLLQQRYMFVTTSMLLSRQKNCFVMTKITLVAAPANHS